MLGRASRPRARFRVSAGTGNAQLYNGLIAPLVNTTVAGWLWYQGENSLCYDAGSTIKNTGYACMMVGAVAP